MRTFARNVIHRAHFEQDTAQGICRGEINGCDRCGTLGRADSHQTDL